MCGCSKKSFAALRQQNGAVPAAAPYMGGALMARNLCDQENMVRVRYDGPSGNHLVPSPTRKVRTYGMHTHGDEFCVHFEDADAVPAVFVRLLEPEPEPEVVTEGQLDEELAVAAEPEAAVEKKRRARKGE